MTFQWPLCLIALLIIPGIVWFYVRAQKKRSAYAVRFTNLSLLASVVGKGPGMKRHIPPSIFVLALTAFVLSMARPTAVVRVPQDRANVMLVFDVSGSMGTQDMVPNRIMAARQAAHSFVTALQDNVQIGVVSFNNVATVRAPLTRDHEMVQHSIDTLKPGGGTAIGDGLNAALDQIQQIPHADNGLPAPATIVLLSDGANNMGSNPAQAVLRARTAHVKINTIGIGSRTFQQSLDGRQNLELDEIALKSIASQTSGHYFYAGATPTLQAIYTDLSTQISWQKEPTEITAILSALGVILFLIAGFLSLRWFQRFP